MSRNVQVKYKIVHETAYSPGDALVAQKSLSNSCKGAKNRPLAKVI